MDECNTTLSFKLPLVFANGAPSSINYMDENNLRKFISFLIDHIVNNLINKNDQKPNWSYEKYEITQSQPEELRNIIKSCYNHYGELILLQKSKILADIPDRDLHYVEDDDLVSRNETDIIYVPSNTLLARIPNSLLVN